MFASKGAQKGHNICTCTWDTLFGRSMRTRLTITATIIATVTTTGIVTVTVATTTLTFDMCFSITLGHRNWCRGRTGAEIGTEIDAAGEVALGNAWDDEEATYVAKPGGGGQHFVLSVVLALNCGAPDCALVQAATSTCLFPVRQ